MKILKTTTYQKPLVNKKGQKIIVHWNGKKITEQDIQKPITIDTLKIIAFNKKDSELFGLKTGLGVVFGERI